MQKESLLSKAMTLSDDQKNYPIGKREDVMKRMTQIPLEDIKEFNNCQSWKEIYEFHKKKTPWLENTQINEIIKQYKMEAQTKKHKGLLEEKNEWMLNDV